MSPRGRDHYRNYHGARHQLFSSHILRHGAACPLHCPACTSLHRRGNVQVYHSSSVPASQPRPGCTVRELLSGSSPLTYILHTRHAAPCTLYTPLTVSRSCIHTCVETRVVRHVARLYLTQAAGAVLLGGVDPLNHSGALVSHLSLSLSL